MSIAQLETRTTTHSTTADTDLLQRLRIALSVKCRAGWHLVRISARNGYVRLEGVVPSFYDRQLIAALVRHVAGVFGIDDELTVGDPSLRQQISQRVETSVCQNVNSNTAPLPSPFAHLPTLATSLDEVLGGYTATAAVG